MSEDERLKPLVEQVLIGEIVMQSKFAAMAADQLAKASDPIAIWGSIQAILIAAANVSKILWPEQKDRRARGEHLRVLLGVDDHSLLSDRTFRNHFEHYDERVEDWFSKSASSAYVDSEINTFPPSPFGLPRVVHRGYNPDSQILSFRGESIDMAAVLAALADIREKCQPFALP